MSTKYFSIHWYRQDISVNIAKKLLFPRIRGTWLPSFDPQYGWDVKTSPNTWRSMQSGIAINWLGIRVRISA